MNHWLKNILTSTIIATIYWSIWIFITKILGFYVNFYALVMLSMITAGVCGAKLQLKKIKEDKKNES